MLDIDESVRPVRQAQRPVPFHLRAAVEKELLRQEAEGIIERVTAKSGPTPWVANLVIVDKDKRAKNGKCSLSKPVANRPPDKELEFKIRLTSDNRAQNKAIRRTKYPCRTAEDIIVAVNGATVFSKLDIYKAYHQVELDEKCKYLTTTTSHIGLWQHNRLHMGISSAQEIFTEVIRTMLEDLPGQLNMTDDILIFGQDAHEHHENLIRVLERLEDRGVTLNKEKCAFYKTEVNFFGMRFTGNGVSPTIDRCQALWDAKDPENAQELKSFLCSLLYSSRFIEDLCTIAEPLWELTKDGVPWAWNEEHKKAIYTLKMAVSTRCMAYFNLNWNTEIETDASPTGLGAVLCQNNPDNPKERHIIAFASRMLTDIEKRYSQVEKEALAVVYGPERFSTYVLGSHFTIVTDNRAVQLIFSNTRSKPPPRIERLALKMSAYDCDFIHRPGKTNVADYYSRSPSKNNTGISTFLEELRTENYINAIVAEALPAAITLEQVERATAFDKELQELKDWIRASPRPKLPLNLHQYKHVQDDLSCTNNDVILRGSTVLIPSSMRSQVLDLAHGGHQGIARTKSLIRSRVWFPDIDQLVEKKVRNCLACQANTDRQQFAPLMPSEMPPSPWHTVSGYLFGPMEDGNYWFVNYCEYSKWVHIEMIRTNDENHIERVLEPLFDNFGVPVVYKTDNGSPFQSARFAAFATAKGFKHRKVTPEWSRANGGVESVMKKLGKILRIAKVTRQDKNKLLIDFLRRYRETPHPSTKVAPAILLLGSSRSSGIPQLVQHHNQARLDLVHAYARRNHRINSARMKAEYDRRMRATEPALSVGDLVLLKLKKQRKSTPIWDPDPYRVAHINGTLITAARDDQTTTRNSSCFKLFKQNNDDDDEFFSTTSPTAIAQSPPSTPSPQTNSNPATNTTPANATSPRHVSINLEAPEELEAVVIPPNNDTNNDKVTHPVTTTSVPTQRPGRPNKEQAAINAANRAASAAERRDANPPTRSSARLVQQKQEPGRM